VNAVVVAKERGLRVSESHTDLCQDFTSQVLAEIHTSHGTFHIGGALFGRRDAKITRLNGWELDLAPAPEMLFVWNADRPGMIGRVGTILGRHHVNIANMHVGRRDAGGAAPLGGGRRDDQRRRDHRGQARAPVRRRAAARAHGRRPADDGRRGGQRPGRATRARR